MYAETLQIVIGLEIQTQEIVFQHQVVGLIPVYDVEGKVLIAACQITVAVESHQVGHVFLYNLFPEIE